MKKGKSSISRIRCSKKTPTNFTETQAPRIQRPENSHPWQKYKTYWKSLWGEKAQYNERSEWIRREERRKISNTRINWVPIQIMEITLFLSKYHNQKSPGSDQIHHWIKAFPAAHRHITKKNAIMEEPEKKLFAIKIRKHQGSQNPLNSVHNCITMHGTKKHKI